MKYLKAFCITSSVVLSSALLALFILYARENFGVVETLIGVGCVLVIGGTVLFANMFE